MTTTPITPAECRELAERAGIDPKCSPRVMGCGDRLKGNPTARCKEKKCLELVYPDFLDARVALRLAMKRDDWGDFLYSDSIMGIARNGHDLFPADLVIDTTGQLAKLLLEWLKEGKGTA